MSKQLALLGDGDAVVTTGPGVDAEAGVTEGTAVAAGTDGMAPAVAAGVAPAVVAGVGVGVTLPFASCNPEGRVTAGMAAEVLSGDGGMVPGA